MNKEIHPAMVITITVIVAVLILVFGYRALRPAPYTPSPGAVGGPIPGSTPPAGGASSGASEDGGHR